jgi:polyhydroxyalkanoate synthesis repressor PhaR
MSLIKRYSNRKLYDTISKHYVTLEDIADAIRQGQEVKVIDHATGSDLTSLTLMQIIFEEEKKIGELLPQVVLTRLLRTGSDTVETLRSRMLAAFDPQQQAREEIVRRFNNLVRRAELSQAEADVLIEKLIGFPPSREATDADIEPEKNEAGSSQTKDLDEIIKQVEALEKEVAQLKKNG